GPAGVGKGTAALAFARALLCERSPGAVASTPDLFGAAASGEGSLLRGDPMKGATRREPPPDAAAPTRDARGGCGACPKTATLQDADLKFLFPVSGEEKEPEATIAETLAGLREDPLFVFVHEKAASIRLSMTRELLRELAYAPYEAARRVVVVRDADRMRE